MKNGGKSTELKQVTKFIADATKLSNELQRIIKKAELHRARLLEENPNTRVRRVKK